MSDSAANAATPPRVVVGVDGSECSRAALRWAARWAAHEQAEIVAVTAWEYPTAFGWAAALPPSFDPRADMEKLSEQAIDAAFAAQRPVGLKTLVCQGDPAAVLLQVSRGAALLVVGSRGHGGFAGLLLGSVSARVAEHATCPVVVVHDGAGEEHPVAAPGGDG